MKRRQHNICSEYTAENFACSKKNVKRGIVYVLWGVGTVCLILLVILLLSVFPKAELTPAAEVPNSGPPSFSVDGTVYCISPHITVTEELPDGFVYAGEAEIEGVPNCPYYTNPDIPEWVYVYHDGVVTDGTVDEYGTMNLTEPHAAYLRYVDARLRGKYLVCYKGEYYIRMIDARDYGENADVIGEYYAKMERVYNIRMEGALPNGFVSVGIAEFSGDDTIPRGNLASNADEHEVYINPSDADVLLVPVKWYSQGEKSHRGFDVYIRYDCPLA